MPGMALPPFLRIFTSIMSNSLMPIRDAVNANATSVDNRSGVVAVVLLVIHHQLHRRGEGHARFRGHDLEKLMDAANCPIATFDSNYSHPNLINVISDDEKGLYLSTKYMINHGHTEIAFVADYEGNIVLTKRFNGYKKALEDSHIPFRPEYIFSYPPSYEGGIEAGRAIAGSKSPITAVVTTADICAIGIMEGARLGGYRVPIDLSVIGYDNLNLCQYTVPKLTSVSQNVPKKARLATELLLKKIHDNESDSNLGEIMDVEIVDRQSVISLY